MVYTKPNGAFLAICIVSAAMFAMPACAQGVAAAHAADAASAAEKYDVTPIMMKTLEVYSNDKAYDATWSYVLERGSTTQRMTMEIKKKGPDHLYVHVTPAAGQKPPADGSAVPETLVVVDGKTAWFENSATKQYFRVPLPKDAKISPLMFVPHLPATGAAHKQTTRNPVPGAAIVIEAAGQYGGKVTMEIDPATYRIRRLLADYSAGAAKLVSTITVDHEATDGDIPDSAFTFKPETGAAEIPAPPAAGALFGQPGKQQ